MAGESPSSVLTMRSLERTEKTKGTAFKAVPFVELQSCEGLELPALDFALLHEAVVVACKEVAFNLAEGVKADTHDDEQAGAAEELRNLRIDVHGVAKQHREDGKHRQEDGSREGDTRHGMVEEFCRGVARLDARDIAALLLEVIRYLDGIELVGHPEEGEDENQEAVDDDVAHAAILEHAGNPAHKASIRQEAQNHHREGKNGAREDDGHDARVVDTKRQVASLHLRGLANSRNPAGRIAYWNLAMALRQGNCPRRDREEERNQDGQMHHRDVGITDHCARADHLNQAVQGTRKSGDDVHCDDDGGAVADTEVRNHFAQPHHQHCASGQGDDGHQDKADAHACDLRTTVTVALDHGGREHRTLDDANHQRDNLHDLIVLLATSLALAHHAFKLGNDGGHQLKDDGRGDVGHDAQSTHCKLLHGTTAEHVHHIQQTVLPLRTTQAGNQLRQLTGVHARTRDEAGQTAQRNQSKRD